MAGASVTANKGRTTGVHFDLQGIEAPGEALRYLLDDRLTWFRERAIGTLIRRLPVKARRDIQDEYNIGARRVSNHLTAVGVRGDDSPRLAGVRLVGQWKRGIGLIQYSARWNRRWKGVRYRVYRGQRGEEAGAFIARMKSGNLHAVQRYGAKDWKRNYVDRKGKARTRMDQRLAVLYRSSVAQMLAKGRRPERLLDYSRTLLSAEMQRQIDGYLRKTNH